jgi:hypothetical protein
MVLTAQQNDKRLHPFIIGIGYKARQGKDTLASLIHERIPSTSRIYAFGDALKATVRMLGWMGEKSGPVLQRAGDLFGHERVIEALALRIAEDNPPVAIITDVRLPEEYAWVRDHQGLLVQVVRLNKDGSRFIDSGRPSDHETEVSLEPYSFHRNVSAYTGDLDPLREEAKTIACIASYAQPQPDLVFPSQRI